MVNFAQIDTVPQEYQTRKLYSWAPDVTLMRTNISENKVLGKQLVEKLKNTTGPREIIVPLKGISQIDNEGGVFYDPEANSALFESIKLTAKNEIHVIEMDAHINDEAFARALVDRLLKLMK